MFTARKLQKYSNVINGYKDNKNDFSDTIKKMKEYTIKNTKNGYFSVKKTVPKEQRKMQNIVILRKKRFCK